MIGHLLALLVALLLSAPAPARALTLWVTENGAGRVSRLDDTNADQDLLDAGERLTHASSLTDIWGVAISFELQTLYVAERCADRIRRLCAAQGGSGRR